MENKEGVTRYQIRLCSDAYGIERAPDPENLEDLLKRVKELVEAAEGMMAEDSTLAYRLCIDVGIYDS